MLTFIATLPLLASALVSAQDATGSAGTSTVPSHGVIPCGAQLVDPKHYTCFENRIACPAPKTQLCGHEACFNPSEYHCRNGALIQGRDPNHKSINDLSGLSDKDAMSGLSDNHGIVVPGPGAYEQLLSDLGRNGIHTKQIEGIKHALNENGFELTAAEVAVILRNSHGAASGLDKFGASLGAEDAAKLDKAMPKIDIILAAAGQTKTGPAHPAPGHGMSGNASVNGAGNNNGASGASGPSGTPDLSGQAAQLVGSLTLVSISALFGAALVLYY